MWSTITSESQISLHFGSMDSYFRVTGHFETSARLIDPKWPETLKGQNYPEYMLQLAPSHKFSFRSKISHFLDIGNFSFSHWPQW